MSLAFLSGFFAGAGVTVVALVVLIHYIGSRN